MRSLRKCHFSSNFLFDEMLTLSSVYFFKDYIFEISVMELAVMDWLGYLTTKSQKHPKISFLLISLSHNFLHHRDYEDVTYFFNKILPILAIVHS